MKYSTLITLALFSSLIANCQTAEETRSDTLRKDALNVYMEASSYIKQEVIFINYVRDIKVADLVIISTSESTGSGGRKYTYYLEGQGIYKNMDDTISFTSLPDETYEMTRQKEAKTIKMGLMRYIVKTPLASYIDINFSEPISGEVSSDKWNSWVFRTGLNGFAFGDKSSDRYNFSTNLSANKITSEWKLRFSGYYNINLSEYRWTDIDTGEEMIETDRKESSSIDILIVKSLGEHWSAGFLSEVSGSIFSNYLAHFELKPGIEYNVYPFSQSTRKQFRFLYTIGPVFNNYYDLSIYDELNEVLGQQSLMAAYMNIQKWGEIDISCSWDNYFHNWDMSRLSFYGSISLQIIKGLRLNLDGGYSFIHDQINLRKGEASTEDVLLSRREMATTYSYNIFFGVSYTFGSIYNNVVNPRFNKNSGGQIIIF